MASPAPKVEPDQRKGTWIFGSLLLVFYLAVFLFGPPVIADYKYRMLGVVSALLGGLFAYFLTGQIVTNTKAELSGGRQLAIQATGGIGLALALLVFWGNGVGPIQSSSQAAVQLQQQVQQVVSGAKDSGGTGTAPGAVAPPSPEKPSVPQKTVELPPAVQQMAKNLAASDPKYKGIEVLQARKPISIETLTRINRSLLETPKE